MAVRYQGGQAMPIGQIQKPAGVSDAEWNSLNDTGKRAIAGGKSPSPGGRFKDSMFNASDVNEVVQALQPLAARFPKVRPALQAAIKAQQAWNEARRAIDQTVAWD
jgi:hypothetical protein